MYRQCEGYDSIIRLYCGWKGMDYTNKLMEKEKSYASSMRLQYKNPEKEVFGFGFMAVSASH